MLEFEAVERRRKGGRKSAVGRGERAEGRVASAWGCPEVVGQQWSSQGDDSVCASRANGPPSGSSSAAMSEVEGVCCSHVWSLCHSWYVRRGPR